MVQGVACRSERQARDPLGHSHPFPGPLPSVLGRAEEGEGRGGARGPGRHCQGQRPARLVPAHPFLALSLPLVPQGPPPPRSRAPPTQASRPNSIPMHWGGALHHPLRTFGIGCGSKTDAPAPTRLPFIQGLGCCPNPHPHPHPHPLAPAAADRRFLI